MHRYPRWPIHLILVIVSFVMLVPFYWVIKTSITGENIFTRLQKGEDPLQAAVKGTQEIAVPVTFGVLTTVVAFIPLLMIEGVRGQLFAQIPLIVIPVLLFSLVESKLILPAHLKHSRVRGKPSDGFLTRLQRRVSQRLERATQAVYAPALKAAMRQRYVALSIFLAVAILLFGCRRPGCASTRLRAACPA